MANVLYLRVSSKEQSFDRQIDGLPKKFQKKFLEKASAAQKSRRPVLDDFLEYIRDGDHVYVYSIDRLARSISDLISLLEAILGKGVSITFVKENLTFRPNERASPIEKLMLGVMVSVAEFERNIIRERQAEGIRKAIAKGTYQGREKKYSPKEREAIVLEANQADLFGPKPKKKDICKKYGIGESTLRRYESEVREKMKQER